MVFRALIIHSHFIIACNFFFSNIPVVDINNSALRFDVKTRETIRAPLDCSIVKRQTKYLNWKEAQRSTNETCIKSKIVFRMKECKEKIYKNGAYTSQLQFWIEKFHEIFWELEILNNFLLNAHDSRTESRIYLKMVWENKCILQKYMILLYCVLRVLDSKELKSIKANIH